MIKCTPNSSVGVQIMKENIFIGIGASAGGLEALKLLLPKLPDNQEYIYIIAQHLDPTKKSSLSSILASYTTMPVQSIKKNHLFRSNTINIIPPGKNLIFKNSKLVLEEIQITPHIPTPSVDKLFSALSDFKASNAVGIVLSGSGHDGAKGIEILKQKGGITIAQNSDEASYSSMPQSAIETGNVDYILSASDIGKELISIINKVPKPLFEIATLLREKKNFDISKYKEETFLRRLDKRMFVVKANTTEDYLRYIQAHPEEIDNLYQTALIGVTEFFRNEDEFLCLEKNLLQFLKNIPDGYEFRVWSAGCSTGQEAYSLAILIDRLLKDLNKKVTVQIFATDIDDEVLGIAKKGFYEEQAVANLDENILQNYLTKVDNGYQIINAIRTQIVFTHHNLLSDPPLINQDLISCRNLLIYMLQGTQEEILQLFHYSLKSNGFLFLGNSESTLSSKRYFIQLNHECNLYIKQKRLNPTTISPHYFSKHLQESKKNVITSPQRKKFDIQKKITNSIYKIFSDMSVVVDREFNIVYKQGSNHFLSIPDGYVSLNILDNIHEELRYYASKLLTSVSKYNTLESTSYIEIKLKEDKSTFVKLIATPLEGDNEKRSNSLILLYFQEVNAADLCFQMKDISANDENLIIENLRSQMLELKKDNMNLLNELSKSTENMQLIHEELQSSNEELQSTNEELETSNEELQSSNEELHASIDNEKKLLNELSLILNSTTDGMIGLDLEGNHTFVNEAALKMLGFSEHELIGQNGHKLWHHTKSDGSVYPFEESTLHTHLIEGKSYTQEDLFWRKDGTALEVEVLQNPMIENKKIVGAVLSFHDITEKNRLKKIAKEEHELADIYLNTLGTIVVMLDTNANIININKEGCNILGGPKNKILGKNFIDTFIPENLQSEIKSVFHTLIDKNMQNREHYVNPVVDFNNETHFIRWTNNSIKDKDGNIRSIISAGVDISNEEALNQKLYTQEHLYKLTFEEADIGIAHVSLDEHWIDVNEYLVNLLGYSKQEFQSLTLKDTTYIEDYSSSKEMMSQVLSQKKESYHVEHRYVCKNGDIVWVHVAMVLLKDEQGQPLYFLKIIRDISQLKLLMYQLEFEKNKFEKIIEFAPIPIMIYDEDMNIVLANRVFRESIYDDLDEIPTIDIFIQKTFSQEEGDRLHEIKAYYKNPTLHSNVRQVMQTKNSGQKTALLSAVKLEGDNFSTKTLYMIAMLDITDIQKKEELMLAQSRQAAMGDMLAMIAHQWRQPLSVISMVANNIKMKLELSEDISNEQLEKFIARVHTQTQYLSHTIEDFRDFFKPDKEKERVELATIIKKLQNLIQKSLEDNAITLRLHNVSDITLFTYANQLIQVIINILNNAKDAIKETQPDNGEITIDTEEKNGELLIKICDNGGGIDKKIESRLGEPYVTSKKENGTGLGLYMSKIIMTKQLRGRLFWECDKNGCCFYVALPIKAQK